MTACETAGCEREAKMGRRYCAPEMAKLFPTRDEPAWDVDAYHADNARRFAAATARHRTGMPVAPDAAHPLVIIPCSGQKAFTPQPPARLYTSANFRLAATAALTLTAPAGRVLILSARHGLLRYDSPHPLAPYDERIEAANARRDPAHRVRSVVEAQVRAWDLGDDVAVVALLPRAYFAVARAGFPAAVDAFAGTRGIGDQRSILTNIIEKGRL